jgi:hypothetical protein
MSERFSNFCSVLRTKINDADKRIKDLKANAVGASEKAKVEAKAQLAALENKAKEQKARTAAADEAERAAVEAVVARMDADGIKAPAASRS